MKKSKCSKIIISFSIFSFLTLFPLHGLIALDPAKGLDEYLFRQWTAESGLPQNTINTLIQTHEGYIWIGTSTGLVRFDGVQFKVFSRWNTPVLKNDRILALYEDENNMLWVGTDGGGLCSYRNGSWKNYTTQDGLSNNRVKALISDWQGYLWVGTEYGLNRLSTDGFRIYTTKDGLYDNIITALALDYWGNLWIGTFRGGLVKFKDEVSYVYDYSDGLSNMTVNALSVDRIGNIWIGTMGGLYFLNIEGAVIRLVPGTTYTPITSFLEDKEQTLWIGTMADGLKRMNKNTISGLSTEDGFPDDFIHGLLHDRDGNIWIGTDTGGLVQLKERRVRNITKENGLPENAVHCVLQDHKGFLWIGTRNSGLCKTRKSKTIEIVNKKRGLSSNRIRALFEDNEGILWIGTEGGGINRLQNENISLLTKEDGLLSNNITVVFQDRTGVMWVGTDSGLTRFVDGKPHISDSRTGLTNHFIRVFLESREGILYVGTREGLFELSGGTFTMINLGNDNPEVDVLSLYEDRGGVLWIGTNGNGLKRRFNEKMTPYTTEAGLHDNYIFSITEDNNGNLWMSSSRGVFRISRKELNDYSGEKIGSVLPVCFDEADGMASRQCVGESQPSFLKTEAGLLYYPTVKGIAVFDPKNISVKTKPPEVIIEDVIVNNESIMGKESMTFSYKVGMIEFHFTAFDFSAPEKIYFRFKLEGYDSVFTDIRPHDRRVARYFNLAPGNYRFLVRAANNDGIWNEQGATFEFKVLLPFYSKPIFYIIVILVILFLGGSVVFIQHKKKMKKQKEKYKTSTLDPRKVEEIVPKLLHLMEEEKLFLNPDLTLRALSQALRIHYNHLSRIINERFGLSYNDFVNKYRIEEAKRKLADPEEKESTILDIIYSTGFYSKSVFNTAFKKNTGMTPSEYRKKYS